MKFTYAQQKGLTPEQACVLECNGWKVLRYSEMTTGRGFRLNDDGLYMGKYVGDSAEKDLADLKEAVFEIERLLCVDIMEQDCVGCEVHWFHWSDGKMSACGWDCLREMYGAPGTPREAAVELYEMKKRIKDDSGTGQKAVP